MTYADLAAAAVDTAFETFGIAASYYSRAGTQPETFAAVAAVTLIPTTNDATLGAFAGSNLVTDQNLFEVRVSEVAAPKEQDRVVISGVTYRIKGKPHRRDRRGLKWTFGLIKERTT
jgi:hypothetical protein